MKKYFATVILALSCFAPWACHLPTPVGPFPVASPTATPTVNLTPVCGSTPVTALQGALSLSGPGVIVIRSQSQWNDFINPPGSLAFVTPVPTPTPVASPIPIPPPPVDFNTQMLVLVAEQPYCNNTLNTITDVCEGPTQVTIDVTSSTCTSCPTCFAISIYNVITQALAVPQSSLPVSVVYTYITH